MLNVFLKVFSSNVSIINELDESIRLRERRKLGYFGQIMRREDGNLGEDILFGKAPGRKGRERSPTRWSDTIRARMGSVVGAVKEA